MTAQWHEIIFGWNQEIRRKPAKSFISESNNSASKLRWFIN
jgi:hypothetical protein